METVAELERHDLGIGDGAPGEEEAACGAHENQYECTEREEDDAGAQLEATGARARAERGAGHGLATDAHTKTRKSSA
jgi:hypothetical protein